MRTRAIRQEKGVSQEMLADLVGVRRTTVVQWEAGVRQPSTDKLPRIAKALGCSISDLFDEEEVDTVEKNP
jgi:transcriptional regulator with XRE-family HTH domain